MDSHRLHRKQSRDCPACSDQSWGDSHRWCEFMHPVFISTHHCGRRGSIVLHHRPLRLSIARTVCSHLVCGTASLYVFGGDVLHHGRTSGDTSNDLWRFDIFTNEWTLLGPPSLIRSRVPSSHREALGLTDFAVIRSQDQIRDDQRSDVVAEPARPNKSAAEVKEQ